MIASLLESLHMHLIQGVSFEDLMKIEKKYYETLFTYWRESNYLTPKWWLLVILSVLSPIVWFKFVDKSRIIEITLFGLFYGITAIILDSIGSIAMVWFYPIRLTPYLSPQLYPYDIGVVIVPFMLVYQKWGHDIKKFIVYAGLFSACLAFIAEPIMEKLDIYRELNWKNYFSFPIYWVLGIGCLVIIKQMKKLEKKH